MGERQSNGKVGESEKSVRGHTRVIKELMKDRAGIKLATDAPIVQWMIIWAAMLASRYLVGRDLRIEYERRRGRTCLLTVVPFVEKCHYT